MRLGVIRVLTTEDTALLTGHGQLIAQELGPDVVSRCIPDQPNGVHSPATFRAAVPKVEALAREMAQDDRVDALLISCAADPGLAEARAAVDIPVLGAGSSAAAEALRHGRHVGVLDLTVDTPDAVVDVLGDRLLTALVPEGVTETRHLLTPSGREACIRAARELVARGADVVQFACTGMTTIGLRHDLEDVLDVPVVDAVLAGARAALAAAG